MSNKTKIIIASLIVFLAAASRLINHPYNFTPIVAMSIFAGCHLHRRWGVLVPLGAMLVSDYFIGFYDWQVMTSVYFSIVLAFGIGWLLKKNFKWYNAVFASLISSVVFFIITNFAVWFFFSWYPHTFQGLINCFTLAIPFFRNSLAGDLFYTCLFFGLYEAVLTFSLRRLVRAKAVN